MLAGSNKRRSVYNQGQHDERFVRIFTTWLISEYECTHGCSGSLAYITEAIDQCWSLIWTSVFTSDVETIAISEGFDLNEPNDRAMINLALHVYDDQIGL